MCVYGVRVHVRGGMYVGGMCVYVSLWYTMVCMYMLYEYGIWYVW